MDKKKREIKMAENVKERVRQEMGASTFMKTSKKCRCASVTMVWTTSLLLVTLICVSLLYYLR